MANYLSTKTYGNDRGLSCCFRQWRAMHSHCSLLHGYSIGIKLVFECETLDDKNWVMDFGGLGQFKSWAEYMFDHTLIIAKDDPHLEMFQQMAAMGKQDQGGVCDLRIVDAVGCEKFAELAFNQMINILDNLKQFPEEGRYPVNPMLKLKSVEVFEHAGNSAVYEG
jgi:6-pyruvoyltetrahydropterin/6-carboxytetrahydropterin synthase